ncbi:hypothetical protein YC2023_093523 [Brassica napus]
MKTVFKSAIFPLSKCHFGLRRRGSLGFSQLRMISLPNMSWQGLHARTIKENYDKISEKRKLTPVEIVDKKVPLRYYKLDQNLVVYMNREITNIDKHRNKLTRHAIQDQYKSKLKIRNDQPNNSILRNRFYPTAMKGNKSLEQGHVTVLYAR